MVKTVRHVNDINDEISAGNCDPVRSNLYDTCTSPAICVGEPNDIPATFLRVLVSL